MRYRELGKTGFNVSEIGFGGWGIGGAWWAGANDEESSRSMRLALELGVNFFDTAPNYGDGRSEQLIGAAIKGWPDRVYVATKVNPKNKVWPAAPGSPLAEVFPAELPNATMRLVNYPQRPVSNLSVFLFGRTGQQPMPQL